MKITQIPNFANIEMESIGSISPSKYKTECWFPFVVTKLYNKTNFKSRIYLLPSLAKNSYLGTIIHKLFEERVNGMIADEAMYFDRWETLVRETIEEVSNTHKSIRNFDITDYQKMYESAESVMKVKPITQSRMTPRVQGEFSHQTTEVRVHFKNLIVGSIDRIKRDTDGIEIIDYKTGHVLDDNNNIKEIYIYQLNLYAMCYESQFGETVEKLTIIQTDRLEEYDVPLLRSEFSNLEVEISNNLNNLTRAIKSKEVENLQQLCDNCTFCNCRHICKKYLNSDIRDAYLVDGIVINNSSLSMLTLKNKNNEVFNVSKLEELDIEEWGALLGKHLVFVNVSNPIDSTFKRTDRTLIYDITSLVL